LSEQKTKKKRILLVDDEHDNNSIFTIGLQDAGFEVDAYNDPELALSSFKPDYYDLLVLDIRMPKMNGYELYENIMKIEVKLRYVPNSISRWIQRTVYTKLRRSVLVLL
jgi:CheY-like chemotaxis protein